MSNPMSSLEEKLSRELFRKLRLATEAESKDDREVICEEVFCDITGLLDTNAREKLNILRPCCFYEVLSRYYQRASDAAEVLLYLCQRLWGQGYAAPIFTLLLHRWLFLQRENNASEQRLKHMHVALHGARSLFVGDMRGGEVRFAPLLTCLAEEVACSPEALRRLPSQARDELLGVVAGVLPYYTAPSGLARMVEGLPSPAARPGPEFVILEVVEALSKLRSEAGLIRYLSSLSGLQGSPCLAALSTPTRLRLQSELYSLTTQGGPHYAPQSVRTAANATLDALFPQGRHMRWLVHAAFRALHPSDWLGETLTAPMRWWSWLYGKILLALFYFIYRLIVWRPRRQ